MLLQSLESHDRKIVLVSNSWVFTFLWNAQQQARSSSVMGTVNKGRNKVKMYSDAM